MSHRGSQQGGDQIYAFLSCQNHTEETHTLLSSVAECEEEHVARNGPILQIISEIKALFSSPNALSALSCFVPVTCVLTMYSTFYMLV